jgi:hypothetical protein
VCLCDCQNFSTPKITPNISTRVWVVNCLCLLSVNFDGCSILMGVICYLVRRGSCTTDGKICTANEWLCGPFVYYWCECAPRSAGRLSNKSRLCVSSFRVSPWPPTPNNDEHTHRTLMSATVPRREALFIVSFDESWERERHFLAASPWAINKCAPTIRCDYSPAAAAAAAERTKRRVWVSAKSDQTSSVFPGCILR